LLSSFDHTDIAAANLQDREHALAILTMTPLYRTYDYASEIVGADAVHVSGEVVGAESIAYRRDPAPHSLRTDLIQESRKRQIPILVYTVNQHGPESLADHLAKIGVDGVFTDDPRGIERSFELWSGLIQGGPR
jgi:glycerophosphoryl diester phosphodiesterase